MGVSFFQLYQPPLTTGGEKELLHTHLKLSREALVWKLDGLSENDVRRPMTRTGTNLLGIVKHLAGVEFGYFCDAFGREREPLAWEDEELWHGGDMWARPDESTEEIVATYRRAWAAADQTITELNLDAKGKHHTGLTVSLRWMLNNVLTDTVRHAGHADVVRELIDGSIGTNPEYSNTPSADDDEYWEKYRARMTGELDREAWLSFARSRTK